MKKRKIKIEISNIKKASKEFIEIWHQVEAGKLPTERPIEKLSFSDEQLLFKTLTPRRCDLLKYVRETGKMSIRGIANALKRDYSNVFNDIKILCQVGLILKDTKTKKYYVPWDSIITEIPLVTRKLQPKQRPIRRHATSHAHHH